MTTIAQGLRKGRSHLIIAAALAVGGTLVVQIEDRTLNREAGKPIPPRQGLGAPVVMPLPVLPRASVPKPAPPINVSSAIGIEKPPAPRPARAIAARPAIQLGAFDSPAVARERWRTLSRRYPALANLDHAIESGTAKGQTVYRLLATAPDRDRAREACSAVRSGGGACFVR